MPAAGLVEALRECKDEGELEAIRAATEIADEIYGWLIEQHGLRGHTERAVAARDRAARPGAGIVDLVPADRRRAPTTARCRTPSRATSRSRPARWWWSTWAAPPTATAPIARAPSRPARSASELTEVYELVRAAQSAALESRAVVGATGEQVDAAARDADRRRPATRDHFGHGTGHGVGLEVHEGPRLGPRRRGRAARPATSITVEPGVYLPGRVRCPHRGPGRRHRRRTGDPDHDHRRSSTRSTDPGFDLYPSLP